MMAKSVIRLNFRKFGGSIIAWKIYRLCEGGKEGISKRRVLQGKISWDAGLDDRSQMMHHYHRMNAWADSRIFQISREIESLDSNKIAFTVTQTNGINWFMN
jgi:hypothetical protein